jgi:hypothetical protein
VQHLRLQKRRQSQAEKEKSKRQKEIKKIFGFLNCLAVAAPATQCHCERSAAISKLIRPGRSLSPQFYIGDYSPYFVCS